MSHITEFSIEGLAGQLGTFACKLNRDVNIFYGKNGVGKTSLLRILQSAMSNDVTQIANVAFKSAEVHVHSMAYEKDYVYTIEKKQQEETKAINPPAAVTRSPRRIREWKIMAETELPAAHELPTWKVTPPPPPEWQGRWHHSWLPTSRLFWSRRIPGLSLIQNQTGSQAFPDELFARLLTMTWSAYSAPVLGKVRLAQETGLSQILQAVLTPPVKKSRAAQKLDANAAYAKIARFLSRQKTEGLGTLAEFQVRYEEDHQLAAIAVHIDNVESEIEAAMAPRLKLEELITRMFSGPKSIEFLDDRIKVSNPDGQEIGLETLSSGEKQLLRMLTEVLLTDNSSVLIDEPEISLHIDWQRDLVKFVQMLSPDCQLIAATHSPEIMAEVDDSHIFKI